MKNRPPFFQNSHSQLCTTLTYQKAHSDISDATRPHPLPPPPKTPGYHQQQLLPSPSRPLSPLEQYSRIKEQELWEAALIGTPNGQDQKVTTVHVPSHAVHHCRPPHPFTPVSSLPTPSHCFLPPPFTLFPPSSLHTSLLPPHPFTYPSSPPLHTSLLPPTPSHIPLPHPFAPHLQRYEHYLNSGVPTFELPSLPDETTSNVHSRILPKLLGNQDMQELRNKLWEEVHKDFQTSMQKSIVDYILMDSLELKRLRIASLPPKHPRHVLRAPLPWHESLCQARDAQAVQLFVTSEVMRELQQLWFTK